jgi:O-antigen/teichoic acid export membrane protein
MASRRSYSRGLTLSGLSFVSVAVIGLVSSVVLARLYGITVIGEFALVSAPMTAMTYLTSVREQAGLVRELARLEPRHPRVTPLALIVLGFSLTLTAVGAVVAIFASHFFFAAVHRPALFWPATVLILTYTFVMNTSWNIDGVFAAFRAGSELFWVRLVQTLGFTALAVVLTIVSPSVWSLVIATTASWAVSLVHRLVLLPRYARLAAPADERRAARRTLPEIVRFGLKIAPGTIADGVTLEAPTWILGALVPVSSVGAYTRAAMLARRLLELSPRINEMLFPTLVERLTLGERASHDRAFVDTIRYALVMLLLPCAIVAGAAQSVMALFGPGFERADSALAIWMIVALLGIVVGIQSQLMWAGDAAGPSTIIGIGRAIIVVGLLVPLVHAGGITGASAALAIGYGVDAAVRSRLLRRHLHEPWRVLWPVWQRTVLVVAAALAFAVARAVDSLGLGLGGLLVAAAAATVAYVATLALLRGYDERDRDRMQPVYDRLRARVARSAAS